MTYADYKKAGTYVKDLCGTRPQILNNVRAGVITYALSKSQYEAAELTLNTRHGEAKSTTTDSLGVQYKTHVWNLTEHRSIALRHDSYSAHARNMSDDYLISIRDFGPEAA